MPLSDRSTDDTHPGYPAPRRGDEPPTWADVWTVFERAVELPADERATFLDSACGEDRGLQAAVEGLLEADGSEDALLDRPLLPTFDEPEEPLADRGSGRLGPYRILRKLGEGGMSVAYLALRDDEAFRRRVVVKVVKPGMEHLAVLKRLQTERQILASLVHPNIARLYDGGSTDRGLPYFVMEHVDGVPIDRYCEQHELSVDERLALVQRVCAAVQYAHQNLVVHRDLKPANILVGADGEPKLLDFGIAKLLNPELASGDLEPTATVSRMMTPSYASPEQVRGGTITTASDVYSLGVLLYRLLTGRLPHDLRGRSPAEVERLVTEEDPPKPSVAAAEPLEGGDRARPPGSPAELRRRLAGDVDAIVLKALRSSPSQRYPSVEQLAEDIDRFRRALPVQAQRGTWRYRAGKFLRRHRTATSVVALLATLLLAFGWVVATQVRRIAEERDTKREVITLMQEIINYAEPFVAPGATLSVREAILRSTPVLEARLNDRPEVRAELLHTTGSMLVRLGEYEAAQRELEEALSLRQRLHGDGSREASETKTILASVLKEKGELDTALELAREALGEVRRRVGSRDPELVPPLNELVSILCYREEFQPAEGPATTALALATELAEVGDPERLTSIQLKAVISTKLGRYEEAAALYRRSLDLERMLYGDTHPSLQYSWNNLGLALRWLGDFEAAESAYLEALALKRASYGESNIGYAVSLNNLAAVRFARGDYDRAAEAYGEALSIFRQAMPEDHWQLFQVEISLESVRIRQGAAAAAEESLRQSLEHWRPRLPADHWLIPHAESRIGEALIVQGRLEEAEPLLTEGFRQLVQVGAKDRYQRQALDRLADFLRRSGRELELERYESMLGSEEP